jgi:hypothetical protein
VIPQAVLTARQAGCSVIPCGLDKRPFEKWKRWQEERPSREQLEAWAQDPRTSCWAIVTGAISGRVVLDFDGVPGRQLLGQLALRAHGDTPRGGAHVHLSHPGWRISTVNGKAKRQLGDRWPALDIRADGGYVIFHGRSQFGEYRYPPISEIELVQPAVLPVELRRDLRLEKPPITAGVILAHYLRRAQPGARNQIGFELACQLRDNGIDYAEAQSTMVEYVGRCPAGTHPYTEEEALASLAEAYGHPKRAPWGAEPPAPPPSTPEPQPSPRAPARPTGELLGEVEGLLRRFVHFRDDHAPAALALYVLHTWGIDAFDATPYVYVKSPQKRSGKTRTLEVLEQLCKGPMRAASITEAAIYQSVEKFRPTLLIDETDAIFTGKSDRAEALRGILNSGDRRGSKVARGSQGGSPQLSETFCPKVLAGIDTGKLPDTIRDRAIVIGLERKTRSEPVERFRVRDLRERLELLRSQLADWAAENTDALSAYRSEPLEAISERLEEACEPLLAIAELAGGSWPTRSRAAVVGLAEGAEEVGEDRGQLLLAAIKRIFAEEDTTALWTSEICEALNGDDELPFGDNRGGLGIHGIGLAKALRPYGIRPRTVKRHLATYKGYHRADFEEAWSRYVPELEKRNAESVLRFDLPGVTGRESPPVTLPVTPKSLQNRTKEAEGDGVTAGDGSHSESGGDGFRRPCMAHREDGFNPRCRYCKQQPGGGP